ncbi:YcaO-like family protein [Streptomyces sp. ATCC 21386]|uniref:YcaO-like family protein n=1 Tax=Streptomyces sp. ATCC 21386 TaxID=2699428 RepID=UPI001BFFC7C8|nr:YcaO-like family protein [Streptomyces sp. ATCC 21386]
MLTTGAINMGAIPAKGYRRGTHRAVPPEETWQRIRPQLARYGVTRVADVTGLDDIGIPVFQAVRPASRTVSLSQGKGLTPAAARVSAAMEAIELWHAENLPPASTTVTARRLGLPYELAALDLAEGSLLHVDLPLSWLEGEGLLSGDPVPVPEPAVRLDHTYRAEWTPPLFRTTSNGLASGNTIPEATAHALAELCERDALARLRARPRTDWYRLDLGTVDDPDCRSLLDRYASAQVSVDVVVADREPACFEARIRSEAHPVTYTGAGCHLDPAIALLRALTEAAQSRLTAIAGARDDLPPVLYRTAGERPLAREELGTRTAEWWESPTVGNDGDFEADIRTLAAPIATRTGTEPIRVVLPSPTGIPVVKVIAPGLAFDDRTDVSASAGRPRSAGETRPARGPR